MELNHVRFPLCKKYKKTSLEKTPDKRKMRELKRNLPIRLFLDILVSGYENRFYETCTYAEEKTYGTGFA